MVYQPIKIEQPLVNHILIDGSLVLDDHGAAVFVYPESVDAPAVDGSGGVFGRKKADS